MILSFQLAPSTVVASRGEKAGAELLRSVGARSAWNTLPGRPSADHRDPQLARPEAYNLRMSVLVGERRVVSVLVADVAGSTAISERLGPERSKFLFDEIVRLMREEVERFGGT